jgi:hypothetical protein
MTEQVVIQCQECKLQFSGGCPLTKEECQEAKKENKLLEVLFFAQRKKRAKSQK